jgi:hypothetical protein
MRKQVLSAGAFADQAARALRAVPSLRSQAAATLKSTGTAEIIASSGDAAGVVEGGGLPPELAALLKGLAVPAADLQRVSAALPTDAAGGPVLIAPLTDPVRTRLLKNRISLLAAFAKSARRSPLLRSRGLPKRYTPR